MSIDVLQVIGVDFRVPHRHLDTGRCSTALRVDVGDAIGIGGRAVAEDLAVDVSAARPGVFEFLEHQHAGTFAEHEAVAVQIEGAAGTSGIIIVGGEGCQQAEASDTEGVDHAVGPPGEHDVDVSASDQLGRFTNRLARGRAGGQAVHVGALGVEQAWRRSSKASVMATSRVGPAVFIAWLAAPIAKRMLGLANVN